MIVLSLFDGMSCGRIAFEHAGIPVEKYYASEVDKYAQIVSEKNYPDIIRLGDVTKWREWDIEQPDIIIGGSPCQGFSFAGKRLNLEDERSKLFFEFRDIVRHYKPKYFLLENVRMDKESENIISREMGIKPVLINSALVSAQNRQRLYWTNIGHKKDLFGEMLPGIEQPKDKKIYLKDIIESNVSENLYLKSMEIENILKWKSQQNQIKDSRNINEKMSCLTARGAAEMHSGMKLIKCGAIRERNTENQTSRQAGLNTVQMLELREDEKINCLTSVQKDNVVCHTRNYIQYDNSGKGHNSQTMRIYKKDGKHGCLNSSNENNNTYENENENEIFYRKLTPIECERLQTVPDNYTNHVSNTQRYKMLGNGWTIDVIVHILKHIKELSLTHSATIIKTYI